MNKELLDKIVEQAIEIAKLQQLLKAAEARATRLANEIRYIKGYDDT